MIPFGVGAVIVDGGKVLIVKRKYDPLAGQWSLPGGGVELGETLADGDSGGVVIAGPAGVGKTRLALQLAHDLSASFADGTFFIALAALIFGEKERMSGGFYLGAGIIIAIVMVIPIMQRRARKAPVALSPLGE